MDDAQISISSKIFREAPVTAGAYESLNESSPLQPVDLHQYRIRIPAVVSSLLMFNSFLMILQALPLGGWLRPPDASLTAFRSPSLPPQAQIRISHDTERMGEFRNKHPCFARHCFLQAFALRLRPHGQDTGHLLRIQPWLRWNGLETVWKVHGHEVSTGYTFS